MNSAQWDSLYGRPPISRDALLFGIAVALHLPLFFMQFNAAVKPSGQSPSFVEIKMRDQAIDRILQKGMALPPKLPPMVAKPLNLAALVKVRPALPVLPPPRVGIRTEAILPSPSVSSPKPSSPAPVIPLGETPIVKEDKGVFRMAPNSVRSIEGGGGHLIAAGPEKRIAIPTAPIAQAEYGIQSPAQKTSKILLSALPAAEPVMPKSAIKVDKRAGTAIAVDPAKGWEEEENLPVIKVQPRTLTPEERAKELFPIHGALKDRAVDRQEIPEYPEWARKKGIESSVKFRFSVTADGRVKENIEIIKGSGYGELDELARTALLRWVFARLPPEKGNLVQDGIVEFRFSIK